LENGSKWPPFPFVTTIWLRLDLRASNAVCHRLGLEKWKVSANGEPISPNPLRSGLFDWNQIDGALHGYRNEMREKSLKVEETKN
jgi:hypothetical protein